MHNAKRYLISTLGLALMVTVLSGSRPLSAAPTTSPSQVTVTNFPSTHLGRPASDLVNLHGTPLSFTPGNEYVLERILADGTVEQSSFSSTHGYVIPAGKSLVITDITWSGASLPNQVTVEFELHVGDVGTATVPPVLTEVYHNFTSTRAEGLAWEHVHLTSAIVVASGKDIMVFSTGSQLARVYIQGYLTQ